MDLWDSFCVGGNLDSDNAGGDAGARVYCHGVCCMAGDPVGWSKN